MNELELFMKVSLADWVIVGLFCITWWMITKLNKKISRRDLRLSKIQIKIYFNNLKKYIKKTNKLI